MSRRLRLCIAVAVLAGASSFAVAQGRAGGAGRAPAGVGSSPVTGGQAPNGRLGTDGRQDALKKLEAERRRSEAEAHNRSADARAEHAPNEHAADEANVAEGNAEKKDARSEQRAKGDDNKGKR
jgi:hypothetical protein